MTPTTNAGKMLDSAWPGSHIDRLEWQKRIAAIEAEAAEAARAEVAAKVRAKVEVLSQSGGTHRYMRGGIHAEVKDCGACGALHAMRAILEAAPKEDAP